MVWVEGEKRRNVEIRIWVRNGTRRESQGSERDDWDWGRGCLCSRSVRVRGEECEV